MSIDERPAIGRGYIEPVPRAEALKRSAQNFLVDVIFITQKAQSLGLLKQTDGPPPHDMPTLVALVATPANHLGSVLVRINGDSKEYVLRPNVPHGLYSRDKAVTYEEISITDDHQTLQVTSSGGKTKSGYFRNSERVEDPGRARVLESFVTDLRPISSAEYSAINEQNRQERVQRKRSDIGNKIAKLFGSKSSRS